MHTPLVPGVSKSVLYRLNPLICNVAVSAWLPCLTLVSVSAMTSYWLAVAQSSLCLLWRELSVLV